MRKREPKKEVLVIRCSKSEKRELKARARKAGWKHHTAYAGALVFKERG